MEEVLREEQHGARTRLAWQRLGTLGESVAEEGRGTAVFHGHVMEVDLHCDSGSGLRDGVCEAAIVVLCKLLTRRVAEDAAALIQVVEAIFGVAACNWQHLRQVRSEHLEEPRGQRLAVDYDSEAVTDSGHQALRAPTRVDQSRRKALPVHCSDEAGAIFLAEDVVQDPGETCRTWFLRQLQLLNPDLGEPWTWGTLHKLRWCPGQCRAVRVI